MEKSNKITNKTESENTTVFFIFIGIIVILGHLIIEYLIKKAINIYKYRKKSEIDKKEKDLQSCIQKWFDGKIQEYEKACIAYGIEIESDKLGISIFEKEKLREKYGKVLLIPSLSVYREYRDKFGSDYSGLESVICNWFENHSYEKSLKQIEQYVSEKSHKKAKQILFELGDIKKND